MWRHAVWRTSAGKYSPSFTLPEMMGSIALTQEDFDRLIGWLDTDRELAARKYEEIHASLVKIFSWRGYYYGEEFADEVINRVSPKGMEIAGEYICELLPFFYGGDAKSIMYSA